MLQKSCVFTFIFIVLLQIIIPVEGLKCYVCTISASDSSDTCVQRPEAVTTGSPTVNCGAKYCTIKRQEYKDPPGRIASFYRGCENNPVYLNTMIEDADFKTYFRACTSDLCNTGNGIQSVSNGNLGSGMGGTKNLLIPGMGTDSANAINKFSLTFMLTLNLILYVRHYVY